MKRYYLTVGTMLDDGEPFGGYDEFIYENEADALAAFNETDLKAVCQDTGRTSFKTVEEWECDNDDDCVSATTIAYADFDRLLLEIPSDYETPREAPFFDWELENLIGAENLDLYDFESIKDMVTVYDYETDKRYWKDLDHDVMNAVLNHFSTGHGSVKKSEFYDWNGALAHSCTDFNYDSAFGNENDDSKRYWKDLDAKGAFDNMASEALNFFDFLDDRRG